MFPAFQSLDVFGPLDALNILSLSRKLDLAVIANSTDAVSTKPRSDGMDKFNSSMAQSIVPTHTFANAPEDLEVLIVPGGIGSSAPDLEPLVDYIKQTYPKLKYLLSVCTGARFLARAGILDGRCATTNKRAWDKVIVEGPKVNWVPTARWVIDGNVWSSSGVSAGIDMMFAFLDAVYGTQVAEDLSKGLEYVRIVDWREDPFAIVHNTTKV